MTPDTNENPNVRAPDHGWLNARLFSGYEHLIYVEDGRHIARGGANSDANVKLLNCYSLIKQKTQF